MHVTLQNKKRNAARLLLTKVKNISFVSNDAHCGKHHLIFCIYENISYTVTRLCRWRYSSNPFTTQQVVSKMRWLQCMVPIALEGAGVGLRASLDSRKNLTATKIEL